MDRSLARQLLEHRDSLFAYVLALVRSFATAEEIFQEVSLVILKKDQEGIAVERFGPWSREVARRMVLNYWKTSARDRLVLSPKGIDAIDQAFALQEEGNDSREAELLQRLSRCLKRLPDHLRQVVDLRYTKALPLQEIAERLHRSAGAVQVALSRIRMKLLECTKRPGIGQEGSSA